MPVPLAPYPAPPAPYTPPAAANGISHNLNVSVPYLATKQYQFSS